jgi:hypothetical protein
VLVTVVVAIANDALWAPAGTVTVAGTVAEPLLLDKLTTAPPPGAAAVSVTVPVELAPPATLAGLTPNDDSDTAPGGAVTINVVIAHVLL